MDSQNTMNAGFQTPINLAFEKEAGYLVAQLDKNAYGLLDQEVIYQGKTFQPKEELHITVVSADAALALQEYLAKHPQETDRVRQMIDQADWSFRKQERFYFVQEEPGVESIIQRVDVPGAASFFQDLSRLLERNLEPPPTHVTLYTHGKSKGIGLPTEAVFNQLVKKEIRLDELQPKSSAQGEMGKDD